jgi:hypothetical protein
MLAARTHPAALFKPHAAMAKQEAIDYVNEGV